MRYVLVLQFGADSLADYDAMVTLENNLIEELGTTAAVDGHDLGNGEMNIFILTSDPVATFERSKQVLEGSGRLQAVTAAYRAVESELYTVLWPEDSLRPFTIT